MHIKKNSAWLYEVDIDGTKYEFQKWGALDATETMLDIASVIGKPLGMAAAASKTGGDQSALIGSILDKLLEKVGTHKSLVMDILQKLTAGKVQADGKSISFDSHYQDRLDHMLAVARANTEVQYGNFFRGVIGGGAFTPQATRQPTPTE